MGADYRQIGVYLLNPGNASGDFQFDKEFTSSTGLTRTARPKVMRSRASCSATRPRTPRGRAR